jgi:hypothetical protein
MAIKTTCISVRVKETNVGGGGGGGRGVQGLSLAIYIFVNSKREVYENITEPNFQQTWKVIRMVYGRGGGKKLSSQLFRLNDECCKDIDDIFVIFFAWLTLPDIKN